MATNSSTKNGLEITSLMTRLPRIHLQVIRIQMLEELLQVVSSLSVIFLLEFCKHVVLWLSILNE